MYNYVFVHYINYSNGTHLTGEIPRQELDWILGTLRSSKCASPPWWIDPLLDVNARGPLRVLDGLVGEGAKSTEEGGLASLTVANEEQLDCTIANRPGYVHRK